MSLVLILLCVICIIYGVALGKPLGWIGLVLSVVALLITVGAWHQLRP
jgi:hypothetical protein